MGIGGRSGTRDGEISKHFRFLRLSSEDDVNDAYVCFAILLPFPLTFIMLCFHFILSDRPVCWAGPHRLLLLRAFARRT